MLELLNRDQFPSWALTFYSELNAAGKGQPKPPRLVWAANDVILLAPYRIDGATWGGFLIAEASALGQVREFWNEEGDQLSLRVPADVPERGAVLAAAGQRLSIVISPVPCDS